MYFHVQADWSIAEMNAEIGESHAYLYTSQTDKQLVVHEIRVSWTRFNRDAVLGLYDTYNKSQLSWRTAKSCRKAAKHQALSSSERLVPRSYSVPTNQPGGKGT
ncbi:uncharacterized protein LOC119726142 isoform X2 [Patiria miniata]|uniref:Uncharacterized protein n=1 Tax=Patiria miniata TaxID=46514 RepID=A0A913ZRA9_PATMI|nr:uncharacterized protein LOC119726142 isoform X2 [Patiria miniata]